MEKTAKLIKEANIKITPGLDHAQAYWYGHLIAPLILDFLKD